MPSESHTSLSEPLKDADAINAQVRQTLALPTFDADVAFELGQAIRTRLRALSDKPAVVNISLTTGTLLFHAASRPGTAPDNAVWIERKRNTVMRFGISSYAMHLKFDGDEKAFAAKYGLGPEAAGRYAIHGGAVPIFVKHVESPVAIAIVSGLKQHEDHQVVVEALQQLLQRT